MTALRVERLDARQQGPQGPVGRAAEQEGALSPGPQAQHSDRGHPTNSRVVCQLSRLWCILRSFEVNLGVERRCSQKSLETNANWEGTRPSPGLAFREWVCLALKIYRLQAQAA
jgi:hypothetical protein